MFAFLPKPEHLPCPECGASIAQSEAETHACERERWLEYQMFQLRDEIEDFQSNLGAYLLSPQGRFELWYAARERERRWAH